MADGRLIPFALAGALLVSAPAFPQALLLFDNGDMDHLNGYEITFVTVADDFEVPFPAQATRVSIGMTEPCAFPGSWDGHLRWWIYQDIGGLPGPVVATGFAPEVSYSLDFDDCPNSAWWNVWFPLGQMVELTGGVRYRLAIHMAADWDTRDDIYWATTSPGNFEEGVRQLYGTGPWLSTGGYDFAFRITTVGDDAYVFVDGFVSGDSSIWSAVVP